ncbi:MAG TPA: FAD-dependent oxidoreductase [Acidimicrobiales bacterium]|nr:FAD-dependent oxidoreductase [Acidimicrobiales bacterium]
MSRPKAAVVGSGVAGLTAAHLLQRRFDVTLLEADDRLGGHAHTHEHLSPDAGLIRVDSGFIVHNRATYPNLVRLFDELGVATVATGMSMSVRCEGCGVEYAGALGPRGVFAQPRSLGRPAFLRMLVEVKRFHRHARRSVEGPARPGPVTDEVTLGEFLERGGYSSYFVHHFMIPVVSSVWSAAPDTALRYPARYLFTFLANHGMLSVRGSHQWYTVAGGSRTYVDAVAKHLSEVRTAAPVRRVARTGDRSGVEVTTADGRTERYERAVVATHPGAALRLLDRPTEDERRVLGAFRYSQNETVLHHDDAVLPTRRRARAAWNYLLPDCAASSDRVVVSYDMNRLQHLPGSTPYIVTLNATERIRPERVVARMDYEHPIYTPDSVRAQRRLPGLNDDRLAFAGAYHGWGFHEDGCRAGVQAAEILGAGW